ncbi:variant erythrocyte surface antigen-1 family protein [Babesia caballi]|uniref:Variant erythrocyte surface antigen-1 family protein n=1 Tax=Babesia caballi TaxID=5871 RepID=A0AAV4LQ69_BABCB|nr:variant erythrocyte surface antigen-1 family protein [Babesia caballi]
MTSNKSLTEPPENLKEAIDWVLRVSGRDSGKNDNEAIKGLAKELTASIRKKPYEENDDVKKILTEIMYDVNKNPTGPVIRLAYALQKFIGYGYDSSQKQWKIVQGGIVKSGDLQSAYTSAYYSSSWSTAVTSTDDTKKKALGSFLTAIEKIYEGLTELYWNCKNEWKTKNLDGNGELSKFLDNNGFSGTQLNSRMTGDKIATQALQNLTELSEAYNSPPTSLADFRSQLEQNAMSSPFASPLAALYLLATYAYVQSTSPATPSFAGYSGLSALAGGAYGLNLGGLGTFMSALLACPLSTPCRPLLDCLSNLKEAADWTLRVTGKDGHDTNGQGAKAIEALTNQVKKLLNNVKDFKPGIKQDEFEQVTQALTPGGSGDLITKLADGLQQFIGYDKSGTIKQVTDGIGLYNDPLQRLRTGVLVFVYGMVQNLEKHLQKGQAQTAMQTLMSNRTNFSKAVQQDLTLNSISGNDYQKVLDALKNVQEFKGKSDRLSQLAEAFKTYLGNVLKQVEEDVNVTTAQMFAPSDVNQLVTDLKTNFEKVVDALKTQNPKQPIDFGHVDLKTHMDKIYENNNGIFKRIREGLPKFESKHAAAHALVNATYHAASYSLDQLQKGYQSYYQGAEWNSSWNNGESSDATKCAKIFLSCIPLIIINLQHLYWTCKQGGWSTQHLNGTGQKGADLKNFMDLMSLSSNWLNGGKTGGNVAISALSRFTEFANATASTYAAFLKNLKDKASEYVKNPTNNPLSALFYCSKAYFQCCQMKNAQTRTPSSTREMLYWLSGLQFAQGYSELENLIENVVTREGLDVAISGSMISNEKLTSDQVTEYIVTTCLHAQTVFSTIQAPRISNHPDEPWLHSLYSNSEFNFTYPSSSSSLLYKVADYVYALQFQFHFLYKQCEFDYENGCGWFYCKFGSTVVPNDDTTVPSSFCGSVEVASGKHRGDKCGIQTLNPSPLQAFLTDNLKGFRRDPADPYSHLAECASASMCHVPMGFKPANLRDLSTGGHLMIALNFFCGKPNTPLPKLCHTLSCVTKRTPRTLSDVFGFTFHLTGQMFNKEKNANRDPNSYLPSILDSLILKLKNFKPNLLYESLTENAKTIGSALFGFSWHCHWKENALTKSRTGATHYCKDHTANKVCDLMSLYDSECPNSTCGKYLEPLGVSSGATFADKYAFTYLSWALYLTDDIYESFQGFLDRFNSLTCKGCRNDSKCTSHASGDHASQCKCPSIVQCADALTVLYEYGFHFHNAFWLKGWTYNNQGKRWNKNNANKRDCKAFSDQLQSVISGNPLSDLLTSIDSFLFLFRYHFLSNLSGFWSIYVCLILYTFFFLLDTLHLRSHLKLTSSHMVPPLSLLTSGTPLPVTKLTYITQ